MAQTHAELVRRMYEDGVFDDDLEQLIPLLAPDVEFVNPAYAVEGGVRRGVADVRQAYENITESFESTHHEVREVFGTGDVVVASIEFRASSHRGGSEMEIRQEEAHTWTFRDGMVIRFEWGRDLPAALQAAGLEARETPPSPSYSDPTPP